MCIQQFNIAELLYYTYAKYKNIYSSSKRKELIVDIRQCLIMLQYLNGKKVATRKLIPIVNDLVNKNSHYQGINVNEKTHLVIDYRDVVIIEEMIKISKEILNLAVSPFFRQHESRIKKRIHDIHNLPRVLLNTISFESGTVLFHLSQEEALSYISQ